MPTYVITTIDRIYEQYKLYRVEAAMNCAEEKLQVSGDLMETEEIDDVLLIRIDDTPDVDNPDEIQLLVTHDLESFH